MSHISRPIPTYLNHNIQKYMIEYNHSLFTVPLIPKIIHVWFCPNVIQDQKHNTTKLCLTLISYTVPYAGFPPALDLYLKGGSHGRVSKASSDNPYKSYSPPKCSCNDQTHTHSSKICTFLLECLHAMDENVTQPISCPESSPAPSHMQCKV